MIWLRGPSSFPDVKTEFFFRFFGFHWYIYFEVSSIHWTHFENSNIALKLKKRKDVTFSMWKQQFFSVPSSFPHNQFLNKKNEGFSPFSPKRYDQSGSNWGACLLSFFKMLFLRNLTDFRKIVSSKKTRFLKTSSHIWPLCPPYLLEESVWEF